MKKLILLVLTAFTLNAFNLTPKNFYKTVSKHKIVVVEYWAPWCVPCSVLGPEFDAASKRLKGEVLMAKYNVDLGGVKSKGIDTIPTIVIYKNGKEVGRKTEILSADSIIEWVRSYE